VPIRATALAKLYPIIMIDIEEKQLQPTSRLSKVQMPPQSVFYKNFFYILTLLALCVLGSGCGGGSANDPTTTTWSAPAVSHVFVLVEENHSYEQVIGNTAMPYTNALAQQHSLATQYYANAHHSLLDYFMLTVGQTVAVDDSYAGTVSSDNVVRALTNAGKTWKMYAEDLPNAGYLGDDVGGYAKRHNPFTYFSDVQSDSSQAANIVPFRQFATDLQSDTLPNYVMIVPNVVNDGHDCPVAACNENQRLAKVDQWVQNNIQPLIDSTVMQDSVLVYTWDESVLSDVTNQGGHVATILIGGKVKTGYKSSTVYQHQSTLRLAMKLLGVNDYPGLAATAPDMSEFF
jgi:phosphatidylinositol-3-phosphatase